MRTKIFVIGSMSQYDEIQTLAKKLSNDADVDYVKPQNEVFTDLVHSAFQKISECDVVMALKKPDGTIGDGVAYEVEFAVWLKKPVVYVNSTECECISSEKLHPDKDESRLSGKKIFRYSQHNDCKCEYVVGIVFASNLQEAKRKVEYHYRACRRPGDGEWRVDEVTFDVDDCIEVFFG